jgi:CRISPR/Cas system-associated endonuclease/helicase Cas3
MPDFSVPGAARLRALDALASDTRSLLRRAGRVQRQTADLGDPVVTEQGRELQDAAERLLNSLEERRREERLLARQQLRGIPADTDGP